jgi:hypothetical protein
MVKELNVSHTSLQTIDKTYLKLRTYKKKVHGLTEAQKVARFQKCRQFLAWHAGDDIIFSSEKMFLLKIFPEPWYEELSLIKANCSYFLSILKLK